MKKTKIFIFLSVGALFAACVQPKREPGLIYMPDMAYSLAYETYSDHHNLAEKHIFYNTQPVIGTIARGSEMPFELAKDATGDSTNYVASRQINNPLDSLNSVNLKEAERLYIINCGICHGTNLDGNGPLYKDGNGPYPAKPATLVGDPKIEALSEGQIFYVETYGKNLMGSYAAQLTRHQRWMIAKYVKMKQTGDMPAAQEAAGSDSTAVALQ